MGTVVLEGVKAGELPAAWRKRVKAKAEELVTVTIAKPKARIAGKTAKKPNATFGMWADRTDISDPSAYVRAMRQVDKPLPTPAPVRLILSFLTTWFGEGPHR